MILGAEIGLLVYGIYTLISGKYSIGKGRTVTGSKARILGFLCVLPLPLAFVAGFVLGLFFALVLKQPISSGIAITTEILILAAVLISVSLLGKKFYNEQEAQNDGAALIVE